jgi:hypothetical protein
MIDICGLASHGGIGCRFKQELDHIATRERYKHVPNVPAQQRSGSRVIHKVKEMNQ